MLRLEEQGIPFGSDRGLSGLHIDGALRLESQAEAISEGTEFQTCAVECLRKPKLSLKDLGGQSRSLLLNALQGGMPRLPSSPI